MNSDPSLSSAVGAVQGTVEQAPLGAAMGEFGCSQAVSLWRDAAPHLGHSRISAGPGPYFWQG